MLTRFFSAFLLLVSLDAFACWKVDGAFAVDGETWKINQKFEHNKEYILPLGTFILKMTIKPGKTQTLNYVVQEKKDTKLILVTQGSEDDLKVGESREIFAKGEDGQPNTILTVKLTNI